MTSNNSDHNNSTLKYHTAHIFLMNKLHESNGVLRKSDKKQLAHILDSYVAFGPPGSDFSYDLGNDIFQAYDMSISEYKNREIRKSRIVVDDVLQYRLNVNIKKYNTLNKVELNSNSNSNSRVIKKYIEQMEERYSSILENAGKPPLRSKILAVSKTVGVSSLSQIVRRANMLFVFYKTTENIKRVMIVGYIDVDDKNVSQNSLSNAFI
jgi:hypothetical protein